VGAAGRFYAESAAAARLLGVRAVLMTGGLADNERVETSSDLLLVPVAPHQLLFPCASVTVHHGGVGTTGSGIAIGPAVTGRAARARSGRQRRPVSAASEQVRSIRAADYQASIVTRELGHLLNDPAYAARAAEIGRRVVSENGAEAAA
jgi:hypothetical protein